MLPWLIGGGIAVLGGGAFLFYKENGKHHWFGGTGTPPLSGTPSAPAAYHGAPPAFITPGVGSTAGVGTPTIKPIGGMPVTGNISGLMGIGTWGLPPATPNAPKPLPVIIPFPTPANPAPTPLNPLQAATQQLKTHFASVPPTKNADVIVSTWQNAYNHSSPSPATLLVVDGKYGPLSETVLKAISGSAPTNPFGSLASAPKNTGVAPPVMGIDVFTAAQSVEASYQGKTIPKTSVSGVSTFQVSYNATAPHTLLAIDGKYGPMSQGALQGVLDAIGQGQRAPQNGYSVATPATTPFSGDAPSQAAGGNGIQNTDYTNG